MNDIFICKICQLKLEDSRKLSYHLRKIHKITSKNYYDQYIDTNEHNCPYCTGILKFHSLLTGYSNTCGKRDCVNKYLSDYNKTDEYRKKYETTMLAKYGSKYPAQVKSIREKQIQTNIEKYGGATPASSKEVIEKMKQTNLSRLGVEFPGQAKCCIDKMKETSITRYGADNFSKTEVFKAGFAVDGEYRKKTKNTNIEKYGFEHQMKNTTIKEKQKNTCLMKYGVENIFKLEETQEQKKKTMLERYGKEYSAQVPEIASKMRKKIVFDDISFDSKAEIEVYKFCKSSRLKFKYQPCQLEFVDSVGVKHFYYPDFEIEGRLVEVKGDHLWKDGELYFPYRNTLTEAELEEKDRVYHAKFLYMKENRVILLLQSQIATGEFKEILNKELHLSFNH
jgi:hypothetical protein